MEKECDDFDNLKRDFIKKMKNDFSIISFSNEQSNKIRSLQTTSTLDYRNHEQRSNVSLCDRSYLLESNERKTKVVHVCDREKCSFRMHH